MAIKDGGQAFPRSGYFGNSAAAMPKPGMTLRDYFAGQAMAATAIWLTQNFKGDPDFDKHLALCAKAAYAQADALIAAREEKNAV